MVVSGGIPPKARTKPRTDVFEKYVAEIPVGAGSDLQGIAGRRYGASAHDDVFDGERRIVAFQADAVISAIDRAILDKYVARVDVEPVIVPVSMGIDGHVARHNPVAFLEIACPAAGIVYGNAFDAHIPAMVEDEPSWPSHRFARRGKRRTVAEYAPFSNDRHVDRIRRHDQGTPGSSCLDELKIQSRVVGRIDGPFQNRTLLELQRDVIAQEQPSCYMPAFRHDDNTAT